MTWGEDRADPWNTAHFLDLAELTAAFGIAYDWLYDQWTADQRTQLRNAIVQYGLNYGLLSYTTTTTYAWWQGSSTVPLNGNWNCGMYNISVRSIFAHWTFQCLTVVSSWARWLLSTKTIPALRLLS